MQCGKSDNRRWWKEMKRLAGMNNLSQVSSILHNDCLLEGVELANHINNCFIQATANIRELSVQPTITEVPDKYRVTVDEVRLELSRVNPRKATGPNWTLKDFSDILSLPLCSITVEIQKPKAKPFLINTWYRPPNSSLEVFDSYEDIVKNMDIEDKEMVLVGDFNCDWSLESSNSNPQKTRLVDIANLFQLEQQINEPTRVTKTTSTLIDLAFSNRPELIVTSGVEHLGISDHSLIYICTL